MACREHLSPVPRAHVLLLAVAAAALTACGGTSVRADGAPVVETEIDRQARLYEAYTRAELARFMEDLDTAVAQARIAADLAPDQTAVVLTLGELLRLSGRYDEAAAALNAGLPLVHDIVPLHLELATIEQLRGDQVAAAAHYLSATQAGPDTFETFAAYAGFLADEGEPRGAVATLDAYLDRHADDPEAWRERGRILERSGQSADALAAYEQVARLVPYSEYDYVPRIRLARAIGAFERGEEIAEECFHAYRTNLSCRVEFIRMLEAMGLSEDLREQRVFSVLQALGRGIGAHHNMLRRVESQLVEDLGADRALVFARAVADDRPRNTQIQARAAWAAYRTGDEDLAVQYMDRVLEVNPRDAEALNFIGYSYAERGVHLDRAEELIRSALDIRPHDGNIQDSLGWVYFRGGRFEEAILWLERAVENIPDSAVLRDHLADAYRAAGRGGEALKQYLYAQQLADDSLRQVIQVKIDELQRITTTLR